MRSEYSYNSSRALPQGASDDAAQIPEASRGSGVSFYRITLWLYRRDRGVINVTRTAEADLHKACTEGGCSVAVGNS